jgi:Ca2+-binding EF-hand superfamily protein
MGCGSSKVYVVNDKFPGQGPECLELMQKLLFTDADINLMYNAFCEFDITGDGEVSLVEFLTILQIGIGILTLSFFLSSICRGDSNHKRNFRRDGWQ